MNRYYVNFKTHGFMWILVSVMMIISSVLWYTSRDYSETMGKVYLFNSIFFLAIGLSSIGRSYMIITKKYFLEIREEGIYYKMSSKGKTFEFSDASSYIAKQAHGGFVIQYKSLSDLKKKTISLNIFDVNHTDFFALLSKYSRKDIYIKKYGEELKPYLVND